MIKDFPRETKCLSKNTIISELKLIQPIKQKAAPEQYQSGFYNMD
jgi:hypothetical protein